MTIRPLHYLEIENFKSFGDRQRIELEHPAVLIGPNNCGKTSAIQALALWSHAVRTWFDVRKSSSAKERTAAPINRLSVVSVPIRTARHFWHNARVRQGTQHTFFRITAGVLLGDSVVPLGMDFSYQSPEVLYANPAPEVRGRLDLIERAASIPIALLYPMSGLETEEPVLQPGRIEVLIGQGQTAQVLRNLCLMVLRSDEGRWGAVTRVMKRLFQISLHVPIETARGSIELQFTQPGLKEPLDISVAGRGLQQSLLLLAYLHAHPGSVLLIDEPDAHLEILRQKQIYVLLREVAAELGSQVVLVTHSEALVDEALDANLTLLLDGRTDDLSRKATILNALKHFGAQHYVRARERGYVLYVEGGTDVDMLRALAERLDHPVRTQWDERLNAYYVQSNYPDTTLDSELERVEGGFGLTPREHFHALRQVVPSLRGLAILDNDGGNRSDTTEGELRTRYWRRYEAENYFITPEVLLQFSEAQGVDVPLASRVLAGLLREIVFRGIEADFLTYQQSPPDAARLIWDARTERLKLSDFAEEYFRRLAPLMGSPMLIRKGGLHRLVSYADPRRIPEEVTEKLDALAYLFASAAGPGGVGDA